MTVAEAADLLGCKPGLVYKLCAENHIGHCRIGFGRGRIVIDADDVARYREERRVEPVTSLSLEAESEATRTRHGKRPVVRDYCTEWMQEQAEERRLAAERKEAIAHAKAAAQPTRPATLLDELRREKKVISEGKRRGSKGIEC